MDNKSNVNFQGQGVNFYCDLKIKGKQIITSNIISLSIKEWIFDIVPRIELLINDDGMLTEVFPLQDGDQIIVELKKPSDTVSINMAFSLLTYTAGAMHGNKFMQIMMTGIMTVKDFYSPVRYRSLHNVNSKSALRQIVEAEGGVPFSSPVSTTDTMTWLQTTSNMDFCKHILRRSFVADDCMFLFADTSAKFNYTSFKTEIGKEVEGLAHFDIDKYSADVFENAADQKDLWFNTYNILDMNTIENINRNYGTVFSYYNTSSGPKAKPLIKTDHPLTDLSAKDQNKMFDISYRTNSGYLTEGNMHPNYYEAMAQNEYLRHNWLGGFTLELNINSLSHPRLLSKVHVIVPSVVGPGNNETLSGEYMVVGIVHDANIGEIYKKRVVLARNGFNVAKNISANTVAKYETGQTAKVEVSE